MSGAHFDDSPSNNGVNTVIAGAVCLALIMGTWFIVAGLSRHPMVGQTPAETTGYGERAAPVPLIPM